MSIVKIQGNASGTGILTIAAPNTNSDRTLTLPDATGTVQISGNPISGTTGSFSGDLSFNSGYGSAATAYGCRAWVSFNGTGTVAIRASGNCSSITDNGTGDYTFNFVNAMPDANYAAIGNCDTNASFSVQFVCMFNNPTGNTDSAPTTSSFRFGTRESSGSARDEDYVLISVFR